MLTVRRKAKTCPSYLLDVIGRCRANLAVSWQIAIPHAQILIKAEKVASRICYDKLTVSVFDGLLSIPSLLQFYYNHQISGTLDLEFSHIGDFEDRERELTVRVQSAFDGGYWVFMRRD